MSTTDLSKRSLLTNSLLVGAGVLGTASLTKAQTSQSPQSVTVVEKFANLASTPATDGQVAYLKQHTSDGIGGGHFTAYYEVWSATDNGTSINSASAGLRWKRNDFNTSGHVLVTWFGIVPVYSGIPPDTTLIQQALWDNTEFKSVHYPNGRYGATTLSMRSEKARLTGDGAIIVGISAAPQRCLFELKAGNGIYINGLKFMGLQKLNYTCGMHWYTNDLTKYYPGKVTIADLQIGEFVLGVNVGMLPSQSAKYSQGSVQSDGIATDAPISECSISGLRIVDCPSAFRISQPNGKLTLSNAYIAAEGLSWLSKTPVDTWTAIEIERFGEITLQGGSLEALHGSSGTLINMNSGNLYIDGTIVEATSKNRLRGNYFNLRMSKLANYGFNSTTSPMFVIQSDSTGTVDVNNSWLAFPYQNMTLGSACLAKGVTNVTTESFADAPNVLITLDNVELRDCVGRSGGGWEISSAGVKTKFNNVRLTSFRVVSDEVIQRIVDAKLSNSSTNLLAALIDNSNTNITTYPATGQSTTGGWTFTSSAANYSYGKQAISTPLNIETLNSPQNPIYALRMLAGSGGTFLTASTPSFNCEPFSYIYVTGWVYVAAGGGALSGIKMESRSFTDGLISTVNLAVGPTNALATGWQPFTCWGQQTATGSKARILLYVENGVDLQFFGVSAYVDK